MAYTLPADKILTLQVEPVDIHGNPTVIEGNYEWQISDPQEPLVTAVKGGPHNNTCTITPHGKAGDVIIAVGLKIDGDTLQGLYELTIVGGKPAKLCITPVGEPQPLAGTAEAHSEAHTETHGRRR